MGGNRPFKFGGPRDSLAKAMPSNPMMTHVVFDPNSMVTLVQIVPSDFLEAF